ncbi:MAG: ABC transporter ATP-binding protein [Anaerolineaceae bacterium]|nr:ABC transporter ATP-binding protein [Anaerolineaceae bacterium]
MTQAIFTEKLCCNFGSLRAVKELNLEVPRGVVFGFLGPNGAGKTTTIRIFLGLLAPASGKARVMGFDVCKQASEIRAESGVLLENNGLYERLNAEENLDYFGRIYHLSREERLARTRDLLTPLGLWDRRKEPVKEWSKGMQQKLAIARAMLHRPKLIILDEPTSGLDPVSAVSFRNDLKSLTAKEGVTVFLNTHNLPEAEKLCDLIGVIRAGEMVAFGETQKLISQSDNVQVKISGSLLQQADQNVLKTQKDVLSVNMNTDSLQIELKKDAEIYPIVNLLVGWGVRIEEVRRNNASLEEIFLALMNEGKEEVKS